MIIIILRKLAKGVVEKAIQAYLEVDARYLKFYAAELDAKTLYVLKNRSIVREEFFVDLLEKSKPFDIEDYLLIDFYIDSL